MPVAYGGSSPNGVANVSNGTSATSLPFATIPAAAPLGSLLIFAALARGSADWTWSVPNSGGSAHPWQILTQVKDVLTGQPSTVAKLFVWFKICEAGDPGSTVSVPGFVSGSGTNYGTGAVAYITGAGTNVSGLVGSVGHPIASYNPTAGGTIADSTSITFLPLNSSGNGQMGFVVFAQGFSTTGGDTFNRMSGPKAVTFDGSVSNATGYNQLGFSHNPNLSTAGSQGLVDSTDQAIFNPTGLTFAVSLVIAPGGTPVELDTTQTQTATLAVSKTTAKTLTATQAQAATLSIRKSLHITLSTTQPQSPKLTKTGFKTLSTTQPQAASLASKAVHGVILSATQPQVATLTSKGIYAVTLRGLGTSTGVLHPTGAINVSLKGTGASSGLLVGRLTAVASLKGTGTSQGQLRLGFVLPVFLRGSGSSSGLLTTGVVPFVVPLPQAIYDLKVRLVRRDTSLISELPNAVISKVVWVLDDIGSITYTVPKNDPRSALIQTLLTEVQVWYDGKPIWWGVNLKKQAKGSAATQWSGESLFHWFKRRFVTRASIQYTSIDQTAIFAQLVSAAQSGEANMDMGILTSAPASGRIRSRNYDRNQHQMFYDILRAFAPDKLNGGFDFDVAFDPGGVTKTFTTYYPSKGTYYPNIVLEWGRNIKDYTYAEDGSKVANEAWVTGGTANGVKFENNYQDATQATTYGVLQAIIADSQEDDVGQLLEVAKAEVSVLGKPAVAVTVTGVEVPAQGLLGVIWPGDTVGVVIVDQDVTYQGTRRIQQMTWDPGAKTLDLQFVDPVVYVT